MKIGVAGVGVVGDALVHWLRINSHHELALYDPPKKLWQSFDGCDAVFICVPANTDPYDRSVDLGKVCNAIEQVKSEKTKIYVRSTVPPGTCENLSVAYNRTIDFAPEFLTARSSRKDFSTHPFVAGVNPGTEAEQLSFLNEVFYPKRVIVVSTKAAELGKYAHNVLGASIVTVSNKIAEVAAAMQIDYNQVRAVMHSSGLLSTSHTSVPGPDGKWGFGGACFPKDLSAFIKILKNLELSWGLFELMEEANDEYRLK